MPGALAPVVYTNEVLLTTTTAAAAALASGKTYGADGALRISNDPTGLTFVSGLPINGDGQLYAVLKYPGIVTFARGGLEFDTSGALVVVISADAALPLNVQNGLVLDADGAVVVTEAGFLLNFLSGALDPRVSFSRASNATQFDSQGRLVWAPANMSPNSGYSGAVVGVVGSGGALPTGWSTGFGGVTGLSVEVVRTGTEDGIPYIDIRLFGVASAAGSFSLDFSSISANAASPGQSFTFSAYIVLAAGSDVSLNSGIRVVDANPGFLVDSPTNFRPTAGPLGMNRKSNTRVLGAGSTFVRHSIFCGLQTAEVIDITYRIGGLILERTGADSPKAWSSAFITTGSNWYGPRFDYHPVTRAARGLLIEEQRSNLSPSAGAFGLTSGLSATGGTLASGPTYASTGSVRYTGDGTAANHFCNAATTSAIPAASTVHTVSAEICSASGDLVQLTGSSGYAATDCYINFQVSTGTIVGAGAGVIRSWVIPLAGGTFRIAFSFTTVAGPAAGGGAILVAITSAADTRVPTNSFAGTFDWRNAQLEQGAFPTSFIPTFGATALRAGDVADLANPPPWNVAGTSFYCEYERYAIPPSGVNSAPFYFGDTTNTNFVGMFFGTSDPTTFRIDMMVASSLEAQVFANPPSSEVANTIYKSAGRLAPNDANIARNGVLSTADTSVNMLSAIPTDRRTLGRSNATGTLQMHGWLRKLGIYTVALPDATLQALTS